MSISYFDEYFISCSDSSMTCCSYWKLIRSTATSLALISYISGTKNSSEYMDIRIWNIRVYGWRSSSASSWSWLKLDFNRIDFPCIDDKIISCEYSIVDSVVFKNKSCVYVVYKYTSYFIQVIFTQTFLSSPFILEVSLISCKECSWSPGIMHLLLCLLGLANTSSQSSSLA